MLPTLSFIECFEWCHINAGVIAICCMKTHTMEEISPNDHQNQSHRFLTCPLAPEFPF